MWTVWRLMLAQCTATERSARATERSARATERSARATERSVRALCTRQTWDSALFGVTVHGHY